MCFRSVVILLLASARNYGLALVVESEAVAARDMTWTSFMADGAVQKSRGLLERS